MEDDPRPSEDEIRRRAYEISQRADGGPPEENWRRAQDELRDELWDAAREREKGEG
jgi:hypothetical protein